MFLFLSKKISTKKKKKENYHNRYQTNFSNFSAWLIFYDEKFLLIQLPNRVVGTLRIAWLIGGD